MAQISLETIIDAIEFSVTRSSGAGGQHVNKTNSAVIAKLNILLLKIPDSQKSLLFKNLAYRLVQGQFITVRSEEQRDQKSNKDTAIENLSHLLEKALYVPKKRVKTKPSKSSIRKRLDGKNIKSNIKKMRSEKF
ncbi:MAG: alternative ribosome rescue aminoacyl-tRNA hydrolase ArfB [Bdellovibrionota bacterium]